MTVGNIVLCYHSISPTAPLLQFRHPDLDLEEVVVQLVALRDRLSHLRGIAKLPLAGNRGDDSPQRIEPKQDLVILLDRLGLTLPAQPPPKISGEAAKTAV